MSTHEPHPDLFGGESTPPAPQAPPVAHARAEQPRLFEPQYEGQLTLDDYPNEGGAVAPGK